MSQPNQSHIIDPVLTQVATVYSQDAANFIAARAAPIVNVNNQAGKFYTIPKGNFFADQAQRRPPGTESVGSGYTLSSDSYHCDVWALHKDVDHQIKAQSANPFDWASNASRFCMDQMLIRRERMFVESCFGTSIWGTDNTLSGSNQWSDPTSSVMSQIDTAKETVMLATAREPNTLILDFRVYNKLRQHPEIRARLGTSSDRPLDADFADISRILGVEKVLVLKSMYNSAVEGAAVSLASISGKHALLCHTTSSPSLDVPSAMYTFMWSNLNGAGMGGINISSFEMPELKSTRIEAEMALDIKVTASDLGYFFADAVA